MKRILSALIIVTLMLSSHVIFSSCGGQQSAASVAPTEFGNITWEYDKDTKTLSIVGDKNNPVTISNDQFKKGSDTPWYSVRTSAARIELEGISAIGDYAFYGMYAVKEIAFCNTITSIGKCAFAFCVNLKSIELPSSVTTIGESAFEGCGALETVTLPESVTEIGERVFAYDHKLTTVKAVEGCTVSDTAFEGIEKAPTVENFLKATEAPAPETDANGETVAPETSAPESTDSTDSTESESSKETETEAPSPKQEIDMKTTIIAIVIFALVLIGIIVGAILIMRSSKNQAKDARTVRKNDNGKNNKNGKKK